MKLCPQAVRKNVLQACHKFHGAHGDDFPPVADRATQLVTCNSGLRRRLYFGCSHSAWFTCRRSPNMRPVNIETVDEKNEVGELDEILAAFRQLLNGDIDRYSKQVTVASRKAVLK